MVMKNYLLKLNGMSFNETYEEFNKEYSKNLRQTIKKITNEYLNIYDIDGVAVILNKTQDKKRLESFRNLDLIGTNEFVKITEDKIKSKGFSLEEKL